jgi:hypothetical protein
MYKYIAILLLAFFSVGCETFGPYTGYPTTPSSTLVSFPVDIISEPSGAVIEINNNYVGKTPLTVELKGWETTRTFARSHTIVAHPVAPGGQTQTKIFSGWSEPDVSYGDTIPTTIYFNMDLIRIPEKYEIDINKDPNN